MSPEIMTLVLFGCLLPGLLMGLPLAFLLGGVAMVFTYLLWGPDALYLVATTTSHTQWSLVLIASPLFIFMGGVLRHSGLADDLFLMIYHWIGTLRGGLAIGAVLICTIFAAMAGVSAVGTVTVGIMALPAMLKRNYDKKLAMGSIMAGGVLGILIPPSLIMIVFGFMAGLSVGRLFIGGIFPGLVLSSMFCIYIIIRCRLQPHMGPSVPPEEMYSWRKKFLLVRALMLPILLVFMVLGSLFLGVASPTEAAAVGGFGALLCAAIHRKLNWKIISDATISTLKLTGMIYWIVIGAKSFTVCYIGLGGQEVINNLVATLAVSPWVILAAMQVSLFILGMFIDPLGILMLTVPIYCPIVISLGFDPIWFGVLFVVNMEMAFLTPPFGFNLFYMKGIAPEGTPMMEIYRAAIPFILLQATGLILCIIFPQIILWLPSKMFT